MITTPCVIFAGGKSSRMGEDKALLPFGAFTTLTEFQYDRLSQIFSTVYISTKNPSQFHFQANFIEDIQTKDIFAPTIGFISAFKTLKSDSFFAISVDAPFIDTQVIQKLIQEDREDFAATIAKTAQGIQPLCGIYHRCLEKDFSSMLENGKHKLGFLLQNSHTNFVDFRDEAPFLNLNNPDQYRQALTLLTNY